MATTGCPHTARSSPVPVVVGALRSRGASGTLLAASPWTPRTPRVTEGHLEVRLARRGAPAAPCAGATR